MTDRESVIDVIDADTICPVPGLAAYVTNIYQAIQRGHRTLNFKDYQEDD